MKDAMTTARRAVVVLLLTLGLLAGCSSAPPALGVVQGELTANLGLVIIGRSNPAPTPGIIEAVEGSKVIATDTAGANGKFSFRLSPGSYGLKVTSLSPPTTCRPSAVVVRASTAVSVQVACDNPLIR